ncbi:hypothetical protein [Nostoc sp. FACHB-190]|uniref:hypothetical protein n=1 Tax=Nostoc sp. FACHB-190 TaxID=2692838 RepID=UPI0018EF4F19|nr:hypothetical protein [Nostoc sp. FACHB-190]
MTVNVYRQLQQIEFLLAGIGKFNVSSFGTSRLSLLSSPADVLKVLHLYQFEFLLAGIGKFNASSFGTSRLPLLSSPADVLEVLHLYQFEFTVVKKWHYFLLNLGCNLSKTIAEKPLGDFYKIQLVGF